MFNALFIMRYLGINKTGVFTWGAVCFIFGNFAMGIQYNIYKSTKYLHFLNESITLQVIPTGSNLKGCTGPFILS